MGERAILRIGSKLARLFAAVLLLVAMAACACLGSPRSACAIDTGVFALLADEDYHDPTVGAASSLDGQAIYDLNDLKVAIERGGSYILQNNVVLTSEDLPSGGSLVVRYDTKICTNGMEIYFDGKRMGALFTVESGATLTLGRNSVEDVHGGIYGTHESSYSVFFYDGAVRVKPHGTFILNAVIDGCAGAGAGAITLEWDSECQIYDGVICDCKGADGAIFAEGARLDFVSGTIKDCSAADETGTLFAGGALNVNDAGADYPSTVNLSEFVDIVGCSAAQGAAIYVDDAQGHVISAANISGCYASSEGIVDIHAGNYTMEGGCIADCQADGPGSAICASLDGTDFSDVTINAGEITRTVSTTSEGTICLGNFATLHMNGGHIWENKSSTIDGAVRVLDGASFFMSDGTIEGNDLAGWGSCVRVWPYASFEMTGGTLIGAESAYGGCIFNSGDTSIENATLVGSSAARGGIIYSESNSSLSIGLDESETASVSLTGGNAKDSPLEAGLGGAIYFEGGELTLGKSCTIDGCKAGTAGGGVYVESGTAVFDHAKVHNCSAGCDGGGVYVENAQVEFSRSSITGNSADCGGGVFLAGGHAAFTWGALSGNSADYAGGGMCISPTAADASFELFAETDWTGNSAEEGMGKDIFFDYLGNVTGEQAPEVHNLSCTYLMALSSKYKISVAIDSKAVSDGPRLLKAGGGGGYARYSFTAEGPGYVITDEPDARFPYESIYFRRTPKSDPRHNDDPCIGDPGQWENPGGLLSATGDSAVPALALTCVFVLAAAGALRSARAEKKR